MRRATRRRKRRRITSIISGLAKAGAEEAAPHPGMGWGAGGTAES